MCASVCERERRKERYLWHLKVVVLSQPLPSPCCQSWLADIFRRLNRATFRCHLLLSLLTGTGQTMMRRWAEAGKMIHRQPQGLRGPKLLFKCPISICRAGKHKNNRLASGLGFAGCEETFLFLIILIIPSIAEQKNNNNKKQPSSKRPFAVHHIAVRQPGGGLVNCP